MGTIIIARCPCGFYSGDFHVGSSMTNSVESFYAPALCEKCRKFLVENYLQKHTRCPECRSRMTFYNEPRLRDPSRGSGATVLSWHVGGEKEAFDLPDTGYLCPDCGEMRMKFLEPARWD